MKKVSYFFMNKKEDQKLVLVGNFYNKIQQLRCNTNFKKFGWQNNYLCNDETNKKFSCNINVELFNFAK